MVMTVLSMFALPAGSVATSRRDNFKLSINVAGKNKKGKMPESVIMPHPLGGKSSFAMPESLILSFFIADVLT
jgi:hypothetical protein